MFAMYKLAFNSVFLRSVALNHEQEMTSLSKGSADIIAQLFCPAAVQFLSTPLHLLGLDLYNNPA
jgi:hypothetical protein